MFANLSGYLWTVPQEASWTNCTSLPMHH